MKKFHLIFSKKKIFFNKKVNLLFFDEFLLNLYSRDLLDKYNCHFVNNFYYLEKKKIKLSNLKKKLNFYRTQLTSSLNNIHNVKYSEKYWGILLDYFLILLIKNLFYDLESIKRIKKKYNFYVNPKIIISNKYIPPSNTLDLISYLSNNNQESNYIREVIIGILEKKNIKVYKRKSIISSFKVKNNFFYDKFVNSLIFIIRFYVLLIKPVLILDGYFNKKNSFIIFFKSFGRIIILPSKFFFYRTKLFFKKNYALREKIKIPEKNSFDKIFNILLIDLFPASFLENYISYRDEIKSFISLKTIGSGVNLIANDYFKLLTAEILEKKGSLLTFQHGGFMGGKNVSKENFIEKKYSTKIYYWNDKDGLGLHYLSGLNKIKLNKPYFAEGILIYQTWLTFKENYHENLKIKYHPYLNCCYEFYNCLPLKYKNITSIKLFPSSDINLIKNIWNKKFGKNLKILKSGGIHSSYNYKIVILDDITTALIELLYIGKPFIVIHNHNFNSLDPKYKKYFRYFFKINIFFKSPRKAVLFLNKNYDKIEQLWKIIFQDKIFNNFKNELFTENKNYINSIIKKI